MSGQKGFTLLEVLISAAIFFVITVSASRLLLFASAASGRIVVNQELFENSRTAMDFILSHIQTADEITLITEASSTLKRLSTTENAGSPQQHTYDFTYNGSLGSADKKFHRLEFGGNELASYVNDIQMRLDPDSGLLTIVIITDGGIGEGVAVAPITIRGEAGLRYKKVNQP